MAATITFFAQARGRYRAPYQFSNEVIQEIRVSPNSVSAESGRSAGAVVNVVTKSGSNKFHGTGFCFLRDSSFDARDPELNVKPSSQQHQFGFTGWRPASKLDFSAESFNLFNRLNRRFQLTNDGAMSTAARFNYGIKHIGINYFPAYYQVP